MTIIRVSLVVLGICFAGLASDVFRTSYGRVRGWMNALAVFGLMLVLVGFTL